MLHLCLENSRFTEKTANNPPPSAPSTPEPSTTPTSLPFPLHALFPAVAAVVKPALADSDTWR